MKRKSKKTEDFFILSFGTNIHDFNMRFVVGAFFFVQMEIVEIVSKIYSKQCCSKMATVVAPCAAF